MTRRLVDRLRLLRERRFFLWGKRLAVVGGVLIALLLVAVLLFSLLFGPAGKLVAREEFIVHPEDSLASVASALEERGLVRHALSFRLAYAVTGGGHSVRPGGYLVSASMDALSVAKTLGESPYLSWIVVPEGLRAEEVGDLLSEALSWTIEERAAWLSAVRAASSTYEGKLYADTYLIPSDQPPVQIVARLTSRFDEATAPLAEKAVAQQRAWDEVITLASIVERESAKNDKALVAGILMNRLERGMLLQVDATLQYLRGSEGEWWPAPDVKDKDDESLFNTYQHAGLPPAPIATPSLASIDAVLNPQATNCLYYLHDTRGRIHCSTTYAAHRANVDRYLR